MTPERAEFAPLNHRFGLYLGLYRSLVYSRVTGASSCMLLLRRLVGLRLHSGGRVERTRSTLSMLAALRRARSRERVTAFRSRFVGLERFLVRSSAAAPFFRALALSRQLAASILRGGKGGKGERNSCLPSLPSLVLAFSFSLSE